MRLESLQHCTEDSQNQVLGRSFRSMRNHPGAGGPTRAGTGFTLLELVAVIALIAAIGAATTSTWLQWYRRSSVDRSAITEAQAHAQWLDLLRRDLYHRLHPHTTVHLEPHRLRMRTWHRLATEAPGLQQVTWWVDESGILWRLREAYNPNPDAEQNNEQRTTDSTTTTPPRPVWQFAQGQPPELFRLIDQRPAILMGSDPTLATHWQTLPWEVAP